MSYFLKPLLGLTALVGSCCSVVLPISMTSQKGSPVSSLNVGGGHRDLSLASSHLDDENSQQGLAVEKLWDEIHKSGEKNSDSKLSNRKNLNGENEFKTIFKREGLGVEWQLVEKTGKNCQNSQNGSETYCGYLIIDNKDVKYRLRVSYSKMPSELDSGRVMIAKKSETSGQISYGDQTIKGWSVINNLVFESLVSFDKMSDNNDGGQSISGISIKKEIQEQLTK